MHKSERVNIVVCCAGLSHDQNMRKMRLLTFMQMAESRKEISYATIVEEMQLGDEDVEDFVIEGC